MAGPPGCSSGGRTSPMRGHVLDRHDDLQVERLARAGVDDGDLAVRARRRRGTGRSPRAAAGWRDRPMRWRRRVASGRAGASRRSRLSARWAPRFVPAMAWTSSTMTCSTPRRISRAWLVSIRYSALRGRDEDVRRVAGDLAPVLGRRVAGPAGDRDPRRLARRAAAAASPMPGQRRPQVALDVVGQRLERRDVQDADVARRAARRAAGSGRGRAGRGTTGTRPGSCRSPSGRG